MSNNDWDDVLKVVFEGKGFKKFYEIVEQEYKTKQSIHLKIISLMH